MSHPRQPWFDDEAGPLVRLYAMTRGRTSGNRPDLDMLTLVVAVDPRAARRFTESEYAKIVDLCRLPLSVAEVAAKLSLPLSVTKILIGDLIGHGYLTHRAPATTQNTPDDVNLLRAVLHGIRNI